MMMDDKKMTITFFTECFNSLIVFIVMVVVSFLTSELMRKTKAKNRARNLGLSSVMLIISIYSVLYSLLKVVLVVEERDVLSDSIAINAILIAVFGCIAVVEVIIVLLMIANIVDKLPKKTKTTIKDIIENFVPIIKKVSRKLYYFLVALKLLFEDVRNAIQTFFKSLNE